MMLEHEAGKRSHSVLCLILLLLAGVPLLALAIFRAPASHGEQTSEPILGQGSGVDHVVVAVRDLLQAQHDYELLGFQVSQGGQFPGGISNSIIHFANGGYLELISVKAAQSDSGGGQQDPGYAELGAGITGFAKKHEGAMFLGLNVSSAKKSAEYLRAHNFDVGNPESGSLMKEGETKPPPPEWYTVGNADNPDPNKLTLRLPIFFIEYVDATRLKKVRDQGLEHHDNTAVGMRAVWFAVHDLGAQMETLRSGGFDAKPVGADILGVPGRAVNAGSGSIVLLSSEDQHSAVAKYLSDHDEGIIALSIEVADLAKAHQLAETAGQKKLGVYKGAFGRSFLLSPDDTHGVWLEVFQRY
jgi:catechol 2,3-dioxygenase-like lactoylglutathione lyase family enzyme